MTDDQREKAEEALRTTLTAAENTVKAVEMRVAEAPPAVQKALASTRAVLASVRALYPASARTDMHTPLDRARTAVAQAQTDLAAAQEALAEAQAALTTAQLSLLPRLQQELAWLQGVNDRQDALTGAQAATARENYEEATRVLAASVAAGKARARATALQGYATDNAGACWQADLSVCGDWAHDDLTIAFGSPSPDGEPAHYWKARIPFTTEQALAPLRLVRRTLAYCRFAPNEPSIWLRV